MAIELHYIETGVNRRLYVAVAPETDAASLTWLLGPLFPTGRNLLLLPGSQVPGIDQPKVLSALDDHGWVVLGAAFH